MRRARINLVNFWSSFINTRAHKSLDIGDCRVVPNRTSCGVTEQGPRPTYWNYDDIPDLLGRPNRSVTDDKATCLDAQKPVRRPGTYFCSCRVGPTASLSNDAPLVYDRQQRTSENLFCSVVCCLADGRVSRFVNKRVMENFISASGEENEKDMKKDKRKTPSAKHAPKGPTFVGEDASK
ncbi:hypothetical protein NP493_614g01043 [Ridgeia piscesae]|uniref:Uncharacterized protein n=1 Tax=Ridgeia piscesae TaxID=27915 RepID=A0AAD9NQN5_RIDPI|nr:hypothetical protein NP493_614g01043 [Ridgeia piscesae]